MRVTSLFLLFALHAFPQNDPLVLGLEQFRRGEYLAAEASFEKALERGDDARARTFLALSRAATGRCEQVEQALVSEFETNAEPALSRLAGLGAVQCWLAHDEYDRALPVLAKLRERHPDDEDVLYQTARLHMKAWNNTIYMMFQKTPASWRVNQISAEIFEIQHKYKEAAGEYHKAIEKNPTAVNLHYRLARAILMESHEPAALEEARQEFEEELKLNPNDAVAHYQVGQILLAQQQRREGVARLERAAELKPDFTEALVAIARIRLEDKETDEAVRLLERAVELAPKSESARYALMRAYRRAGRNEDAMRQKEELDKLQKPPEGEFTDFLKRIGERPSQPEKP